MWIMISIPLMVLGVAIAVVPVWLGSVHFHKAEHGPAPTDHPLSPAVAPAAGARTLGVECPLCAATIAGATEDMLVDAVQRHSWRSHGIPSAPHILETAVAV